MCICNYIRLGVMSMNLTEFKNYIKGKNVAVIGIGRSNMPLIELLNKYGAVITACDKRENLEGAEECLKNMGVVLSLGEKYLENLSADIVFPAVEFDKWPLGPLIRSFKI